MGPRAGLDGCGKSRFPTGIGSQDRPARSQSLTPRKDPVSIVQEAGWAPGPVWTGAENLASPPGIDPRTVQAVTSRYTD